MKFKRAILYVLLALMAPAFSGCWYVVAAGAGAGAGYLMRDKGYQVQKPIEKKADR